MSGIQTKGSRRWCVLLLTAALAVLGSATAVLSSASAAQAHGSCPRPDRASNVIIFQPGRLTATFPGSRSASYCDGAPAYAKTALWPGARPTSASTVTQRGGTWTVRDDGRISFRVSRAARVRPAGDRRPGHDVIMKFAIVDTKGHYQPGIALAYVVYPGSSAFPDTIDVCHGDRVVSPLANDIPGWRGTNSYDKRQAKLRPATLRVSNAPQGEQVRTEQGTWQVLSQGRVRFVPRASWKGSTAPMRYSVQDTFGNTASSTITARSCQAANPPAASESPGAKGAGPEAVATSMKGTSASSSADDAAFDSRAWFPLGLAALCLLVGGLVLRSRRGPDV